MSLEEEIAINQFGQGLHSDRELLNRFTELDEISQREWLNQLAYLVLQSSPMDADINQAIIDSTLKATFTPCVMLRTQGVNNSNSLTNLLKLPANELWKVNQLLLYLFRVAYQRRYKREKGDPNKWWYWDLSNANTVQKILSIQQAT